MRRRDFVALFGSVAVAWPGVIRAEEGYRRLLPLLIDLPGWTGTQPTGTQEEGKSGPVVTASRGYTQGDAVVRTSLSSGTADPSKGHLYINVKADKRTSTIDGFEVTTYATPVVVSITIAVRRDATLSFLFNGVSEGDAMAIARKFDWKQIQALLE